MRGVENGRKKDDVFHDVGIVNFMTQTIWKNRTKFTSALEGRGPRITRFREGGRIDGDEALLKWFKRERSDDVPVSGVVFVITLPLPKFES
jgi:hypothetical protein